MLIPMKKVMQTSRKDHVDDVLKDNAHINYGNYPNLSEYERFENEAINEARQYEIVKLFTVRWCQVVLKSV